jgi:hypothetical protein
VASNESTTPSNKNPGRGRNGRRRHDVIVNAAAADK